MTAVSPGPGTLDGDALRRVFGAHPSGVTVLAADLPSGRGNLASGRVGLAASSFTSVSLQPPLVSVSIAATSRTWPALREAPHIGISVLAEHHEPVSRQLSTRGVDRFAGFDWRTEPSGAVLLADAAAWLDTSVYREVEAGDHTLVLLRIHALQAYPQRAPLVFHGSRYRRLAEG